MARGKFTVYPQEDPTNDVGAIKAVESSSRDESLTANCNVELRGFRRGGNREDATPLDELFAQ